MTTHTQDTRLLRPAYRSRQTDDSVELQIALPGAEKNETTLTAKEGVLVIEAPRQDLGPDRPANYRLSLKISDQLDATEATAAFDLGILDVTLPVRQSAKAATISIN